MHCLTYGTMSVEISGKLRRKGCKDDLRLFSGSTGRPRDCARDGRLAERTPAITQRRPLQSVFFSDFLILPLSPAALETQYHGLYTNLT